MRRTESEQRFFALATLAVGIGTALTIVLTSKGRIREVYPIAVAGAVSTAVVYAAYALGGDLPPRIRI